MSTSQTLDIPIQGMDCAECTLHVQRAIAALGFLPPILAAAVQSLPDLGILANSSRLLRHR